MRNTIELKNSVQGLVLLKELNDMIETETVTDFGKEMLINLAQAVVAATETKEHEEIDCHSFDPSEDGEYERIPDTVTPEGYCRIDGKLEVY